MRNLLIGGVLGLLGVALVPAPARAGMIVEGSVGKGVDLKPEVKATTTNLMVAPGITFLSMLRVELGLVAALPDVEASKFDVAVRPMVVIAPPILPLYGRAILSFSNLLHEKARHIAYGGAVGFKISLFGVGVFAEAGLLPYSFKDQLHWNVEGRVGAYFGF